ncbi:MAG: helix-turn-helix transcriptional regulator [Xanthobacteraceae bacterium]
MSGILAKDPTKKCVNASFHAGLDPHFQRLYAETYGKLGPVAITLPGEVEQVSSIPELIPYEEFCRSRFYQEWAQPQGWVDVAIAVLEKSANTYAYLSVARDEANGMVDEEMRRRLALVVPHVRRAILVGKAIDFKTAEAAALTGILDELSAGLVLVDRCGRIVHSNTAGNEILDANDFLRSAGGRLVAADPQLDQSLRQAISAAGEIHANVEGMALPMTAHNGERYVVHLLPLNSGARCRTGAVYSAVAAVFVCKAAMDSLSSPEVIGKAYKLTPAELRVLLAIVQIGGVPEVAAALGVAETTVKTHLGRLFEKTRTGRQADLVKVVAGYSTPLAH